MNRFFSSIGSALSSFVDWFSGLNWILRLVIAFVILLWVVYIILNIHDRITK
jgi:hypothetical protein